MRRLAEGMAGLKQRARTLVELAQSAAFYVRPRPIPLDDEGRKVLDEAARAALAGLAGRRCGRRRMGRAGAGGVVPRSTPDAVGIGFGKLAQPLRAALTGATVSPGLFEIMRVLGRDEVLARLEDAATGRNPHVAAGRLSAPDRRLRRVCRTRTSSA